jgi:Domain of unknown function (DUF3846)
VKEPLDGTRRNGARRRPIALLRTSGKGQRTEIVVGWRHADMAYISYPDGRRSTVALPISLERAQEIVGGYVERVAPKATPKIIFLCNEDGHSKGLEINAHGSTLYGQHGMIVGTIIVFENRKEAKGWL